jgi:hypothetical protein
VEDRRLVDEGFINVETKWRTRIEGMIHCTSYINEGFFKILFPVEVER